MRDLPAEIVAVVAQLLRGDRREWGLAMVAELAQLREGPARWRFALGSARAALMAPPHPNAGAPSVAVRVMFVAGVVGCIVATAVVLTTWPHAAGDISSGLAMWFAASLAMYLWIALHPPHVLVAHGEAARNGALLGFALFIVTAVGVSIIEAVVPPSNDDAILGMFLVVAVVGTYCTTAFVAARAEGSFGAGVTASLWVGLVCSILSFNADLLTILVRFNLDVHMRHVMPDSYTAFTHETFLSKHIGSHLASSMAGLRTLPLLALGFGLIGAAVERWSRAAKDPIVTEAS